MFEHILVAVDFSPGGERLLPQVERLRALGCRRLTLAHVIASGYGRAPEVTHRDHYEQRLDTLAASLRDSGFDIATEVTVGQVAAELLRIARAHGAGVILAGTHGHSTLRDLFLGSTVLETTRLTTVPLLLAPTGEAAVLPSEGVCRPLLATDASPAAQAAEEAFLTLLPHCQRGVVVSVGEWDRHPETAAERQRIEVHIQRLAGRAPEAGFEVVLPGRGKPSAEIARVADEHDVDLIIVGKRGSSPVTNLLLGSTAEAVCRNARRLVLLVPSG